MDTSIATLEKFFGSSFQFEGQRFGLLTHFDGVSHWALLYVRESQSLKVCGHHESGLHVFPIVEIEVSGFSDCAILPVNGIGSALVIGFKSTNKISNNITITKLENGRLSLCVGVGASQS